MKQKIGIFGLGYVGLTTTACLLRKGFSVIGYEVSEFKRAELLAGRCPLSEPGVEPVLQEGLKSGAFTVAPDLDLQNLPDAVFICVGTPSAKDGSTDLTAVRSVFARLEQLALHSPAPACLEIALRSTVPPGTLDKLEQSFPILFTRFPVVFYPEFLREGTAIRDFETPPQTVLGCPARRPRPEKLLAILESFGFQPQLVAPSSAEALKVACNAFHAVKICFANEVGRVVTTLGGDANEVMRLFIQDTQLNISARYLKPGAPYGGSCLPKDVRSFCSVAKRAGVPAEMLGQCELSNASHLQFLVAQVLRHAPRTVALLGLAFKNNTDDLRESPSLGLAGALLASGVKVQAHDFEVLPGRLTGVNQTVMADLLRRPGFTLESSLPAALGAADVVLLMHRDARYQKALADSAPSSPARQVLDVAGWNLVR